MKLSSGSVAAAIVLCGTAVSAVNTVEVLGNQFVDTVTNKRMMVIGIDYQPGGQSGYKPDEGKDPLSDPTVCLRDATLMQSLGVNTIRVYNLDPNTNHDECASIFNYAGIYMMLDVNSPLPHQSLNREQPETTYHAGYLSRVFAIIEGFKDYPNTLAFFASNEVINDVPTAEHNPPYIRAVIRDMRQYIKNHAGRQIPVGYSAADVRDVLKDTWDYLQCSIKGETDDISRSDFFSLNSYSWCGPDATFDTSGYDDLITMFAGTSIPVFFSEYGCNKVQPRVFNEIAAIYGPDMTLFSGGLVYEYSQEEADYGLVVINQNGTIHLLRDFANLQSQYNKLDMALLQAQDPSKDQPQAPECSSSLIKSTDFNSTFVLPATPKLAVEMIKSGLKDAPVGKLVTVDQTKMPVTVYAPTWAEISGLELKAAQDGKSNLPSGADLSEGKSGSAGLVPAAGLLAAAVGFAVAMLS